MRLSNMILMACRNIRHHGRYTIGSSLVIGACFMGLAGFRLYIDDVKDYLFSNYRQRHMYGHLIIESRQAAERGEQALLTAADQAVIEDVLRGADSDVRAWARSLEAGGLIRVGQRSIPFAGRGLDLERARDLRGPLWAWDTVAGPPLDAGSPTGQVLLGRRLSKLVGCDVPATEDDLGRLGYPARDRPFSCAPGTIELRSTRLDGSAATLNAQVTGVWDALIRELDIRAVVTSLATMQGLLGTDGVSYYSVDLRDPTREQLVAARLAAAAAERGPELTIRPWRLHPIGDLYRRIISLLDTYAVYITGIIVVLGSLVVSAAAIKLVGERTPEIGMLRALGFKPAQIASLFAIEATLIAFLGALTGAVATVLLTALLDVLKIEYYVGGATQPTLFLLSRSPMIYGLTAVLLVTLSVAVVAGAARAKLAKPIYENLWGT